MSPLSEADYFRAWIQQHLDLITAEREAEVNETALLFSRSSHQLLAANGLAVLSLVPVNVSVGLGGKTLIELEPDSAYHPSGQLPPNVFRPGDLAGLAPPESSSSSIKKSNEASSKKSKEGDEISGVVSKVSDNKIVLAVDDAKDNKELDVPQRCNLLKLANDATFDRMAKTMNDFRRKLLPSPDSSDIATPDPLTSVLLGLQEPSPRSSASSDPPLDFMDVNLNDSQKEAVKLALDSPELALIHGPPGTGKTHTLVEVVRQLVAQSKSVLVCGASNLAVDNLVERLALHQVPLTRLGHPARIVANIHASTLDYQMAHSNAVEVVKGIKTEIDTLLSDLSRGKIKGKERKAKWEEVKNLRKEYRKREAGAVKQVVGRAKVVLATCHGAGGRQLLNQSFDVVIIDEAAQAAEAVCWIPILKAKKLILAGDHLQLPPTVKATETKGKAKPAEAPERFSKLKMPKSMSLTLFDRMIQLYGKKVKRMLQVQYRMAADISDFPAREMYHGELTAADSVKDRRLDDLATVETTLEDEELLSRVIFYDTTGLDFFERTDEDAIGVRGDSKYNENEAEVVTRHVKALVDLGVPQESFSLISPYSAQVAHLTKLLRPQYPDIEIGTVDGFQGRENDVVILSLVRSNDKREVGFLSDQRRLNVAMTRPRRQLCVVGDSGTVSNGGRFIKDWLTWLEEHALVLPPVE